MKKLDILITHKDRNNMLMRLYNSIINEKYSDDVRIVIQDDDSKNVPEICSVRGSFGSSSKAKINISKYIESNYFMFIDSDDYMKKGFLDIILNNYEDKVLSSFLFENEYGEINKRYLSNDLRSMIASCSFRYPCVISSQEYFDSGGIKEMESCADVDLYWRMFFKYSNKCIKNNISIMIKTLSSDSYSYINKEKQDKMFKKLRKKYLNMHGYHD